MTYYIPTKIHFGNGSLSELERVVKEYNPKNIFLVTGKNFAKKTGLRDKMLNYLKGYEVFVYDNVNPVPKLEDVNNAINTVIGNYHDLIIGIGGGSVLDTSKIVSVMLKNDGKILDYHGGKKIKNKGVPLIAIPTTAGTGSEVTPFAAFYYNKRKKSFGSIEDYLVYPDHAIVDPELTLTMPKELTASSGLDALSQALESYWSINSNPLSDTHAIQSIKLILENLDYSYERINDVDARFNMSKASLEAGLAFSQTATTAPHSISYPMTAHFNLSHGFACALTLPEFLLYNYNINKEDCLDKRGYEFVKKRLDKLAWDFGFKSLNDFYDKIRSLMKKVDAPLTLTGAGINDIEIILNEGFSPERMNNNPRKVTRESLKRILEKIY